jgi:hypothetical protein
MNKEKKSIMDYTRKQLTDYANKLEDLLVSINPNYYTKSPSGFFKTLTKSGISAHCSTVIINIMNSKVERHSKFFWNDGTSNSIKQDLYNIIDEKNDLVDKFIHTDCFNLYWVSKIIECKIKRIDSELLKYSDVDPEEYYPLPSKEEGYPLPSKEEVITKWNEYKNKHPIVELFDDDEPFH